jgi:homoserine O-acetyltransferase
MSDLSAETKFIDLFSENDPLLLDNGRSLFHVSVAYQSYGKLNSEKDNVIMVNHALTGNAHAAGIIEEKEILNASNYKFLFKYNKMFKGKEGWWSPLIGPGRALDTNKYLVICSNVLGSCYGTHGPSSINTETKSEERLNFPKISVRDMVNVQKKLMDYLGVKKIKLALGGSLGGMQVLEWAVMYPEMIKSIMPIATAAGHSSWAIGFNEASRNAILNDPEWENGNYSKQPEKGIYLARKIAMLTYRSYGSFEKKFGRKKRDDHDLFEVESYLNYQGYKLTQRFDANTYIYLSEAMDNHDIGHKRGSIIEVLKSIKCRTACIGISSDILYPPEEQKSIAELIPGASYSEINSIHGHDAFLIEFDQLDKIIREFLN